MCLLLADRVTRMPDACKLSGISDLVPFIRSSIIIFLSLPRNFALDRLELVAKCLFWVSTSSATVVGGGHFYAAVRRTEEATGPKV